MSTAPATPGTRQAYWDVARAFLMFLGIPYHSALIYARPGFGVLAVDQSVIFQYLEMAIHSFRMQAFFLVSGYFAGLLLARRSPDQWVRDRFIRLGAPLLAGIVLINIAQMWLTVYGMEAAQPRDAAQAQQGFLTLLTTPGRHWLSHLWFLVVVLEYSALAALAHHLWPRLQHLRVPPRMAGLMSDHLAVMLLVFMTAAGAFWVAARVFMSVTGLYDSNVASLLSLSDFLVYAPYFAGGMVLSRAPAVLEAFTRPRLVLWIGAAVAVAIACHVYRSYGGESTIGKVLTSFVGGFSGVLMAHVVLSGARRWFDRPNPIVTSLVAGAMAIYIVHQPVLKLLGIAMFRVDWPIAVEFALIVVLTFLISYLFYRVARLNVWTNLFFNGTKPKDPRKSAPVPPGASSRSLAG